MTILAHTKFGKLNRIRNYDILNLIPQWSFFAPIPATEDIIILYRCLDDKNNISNWKEIGTFSNRTKIDFIWNPKKRFRKSILDIAVLLSRTIKNNNDASRLKFTVPYLLILNYISCNLFSDVLMSKVQFLIVTNDPLKQKGSQSNVLLISEIHRLYGSK
ncbi:hypothetical protein ACWGOQ_0012640 [Aquimarina sp. M1]